MLYQGEEQRKLTKVIQLLIDENGIIVGRFNNNPALNTLVYDFEFPGDGVK